MHLSLPAPSLLAASGRPLLDPNLADALPVFQYDVVVVGAGVAGLAFALHLPDRYRVALLTKGALGESNTRLAQGGLSAAIGEDDSPGLHEEDTIAAGAGLCDRAAVRELVDGAPAAVDWLLALDTRFDRDQLTGRLLLGREAAHSRRRVLHAGGDATGAEIERALVAAVRERRSVDRYPHAFAIDLTLSGGRCTGLLADLGPQAGLVRFAAATVVIAAGGAGQLWASTSNPPGATADGLAMALRAGVAVADLEFAQFHPTVLSLSGSAPFLVSEAVRGEGAHLRNAAGERFMVARHPLAELAPRDVVAREIQRQMALDGTDHVHLDLRHLDRDAMSARFPTIAAELARRGLGLTTDLIPVAPAAHYFMGGIVAGTDGRTSLPGLLALGEAACTGVHGANRLASNSLLEGLVFGRQAAAGFAEALPSVLPRSPVSPPVVETTSTADHRLADLRRRVRRAMSRHVAVVRDRSGLESAAGTVDDVLRLLSLMENSGRDQWEAVNLALAARAVISAAILREESRGAHYRADFPETNPTLDERHIVYGGNAGNIWRLTSLADARSDVASVQ